MFRANKIFKNKHYEKAFTLTEVLVSLSIFSLVLTAIAYVLTVNLNDANAVKNNFIAGNLTQEGIELARNMRDADWFAVAAFGASVPDGTYRVQWNSSSLMPALDAKLKLDAAGFYNYDAGTDTIFSRAVSINTVTADVEKKIIVTVSWNERGIAKSISAEEHLFNWK